MNFFLAQLNDEELKILVKEELGVFLEPIKLNEKSYLRYSSQLGSKRKDSLMVKSNLPKISVSLYRKQDKNYVKAMEYVADKYATVLMDVVNDILKTDISPKKFTIFTDEQVAELILKYQSAQNSNVDLELFWIQLKLVGFENVDERKENIIKLLGLEGANIEEEAVTTMLDDNEKEDISSQTFNSVKHTKVKKLRPEEKAAKTKAAIEAKERARQEEQKQDELRQEVKKQEM